MLEGRGGVEMDLLYYIATVIVVVLNLVIGIFVLLKDRKNIINRLFAAIELFIVLWVAVNFFADNSKAYYFALLWAKLTFVTTSSFAWLLMWFVLIFPNNEKDISLRKILFLLFPNILICLLMMTDLIVSGVSIQDWGVNVIFGKMHIIFAIYFVLYIILALSILIFKGINSVGRLRMQLFYIVLGLSASIIIATVTNLILPMSINYFYLSKYGHYSFILFAAISAYAITKHHLMDINVIISRAVAELLSAIVLGSIYVGLALSHVNYISPNIGVSFVIMTVLYGILIGQIHQRVRLFFQTTADKVFLKGKYNYYKELSDISSQLIRSLSIDNIIQTLHKAFYEVIEVSNPRIYLSDDLGQLELKGYLGLREPSFQDKELILPCRLEARLIALIILGPKLSEDPYTDEDLRLLRNLANQTAVALDHHRMYEEKFKYLRQIPQQKQMKAIRKWWDDKARNNELF